MASTSPYSGSSKSKDISWGQSSISDYGVNGATKQGKGTTMDGTLYGYENDKWNKAHAQLPDKPATNANTVKCALCNEMCWEQESVFIFGKSWHRECLNCKGCNRNYSEIFGKMTQVKGDNYCMKCWEKDFKPKDPEPAPVPAPSPKPKPKPAPASPTAAGDKPAAAGAGTGAGAAAAGGAAGKEEPEYEYETIRCCVIS